jgi:membrane fusion protein (multidrug efflux system)
MKMITLGRAVGNRWLILSGLVPGDQVIVEGLQFVRPGMVVKVAPFHEKTNGSGQGGKTGPKTLREKQLGRGS